MKYAIILIPTLWMCCNLAVKQTYASEPTIAWERTYGGQDYDEGYCVQETNDGGFIISGTTRSGTPMDDAYLVKTDSYGNKIWSRNYGSSYSDSGMCVQEISGGGFIVTGRIGYTSSNTDLYLFRTDSSGAKLWEKRFGGSDYDVGSWVIETEDGCFVVAGGTYRSGFCDGYLLKIDSSGNELWSHTFGGQDYDYLSCVQKTNDGGFILAGNTDSFATAETDIWLIKTDSSGKEIWSQVYGGQGDQVCGFIQETTDGGFIIVGGGWSDILLIKTDNVGKVLWSNKFGGPDSDYGECVIEMPDGGYIITGSTYSFGAGGADGYLVRINSFGNEIWSYTLGGENRDAISHIASTSDGGFVTVGSTSSEGAGKDDVYLAKFFEPVIDTPLIFTQPEQIRFVAYINEPEPGPKVLSLWNSGIGEINWQASEDCPWLKASPLGGTSIGEADEVTLTVNLAGLSPGEYVSDLIVSDTNASNSPVTIPVTLYLRPEGGLWVPQDFPTIQAAIDAAFDGDTVTVTDGIYTGEGNYNIDFKGKAITVRSQSGPDNCIIDCNGTETEPRLGFYFRDGEDANSILDGFTITNGYYRSGGAILCNKSSPKIANCIITGNSAKYYGGGINCQGSHPEIIDCNITGNSAENVGGGISCDGSSPTITNCTITGNSAIYGGGIYNDGGKPTVTNCTITGNSCISNTPTPGQGGGIYCGYSNAVIKKCTISGNISDNDGGISCEGGELVIIDCIVSGNSGYNFGGGIASHFKCNTKITNCIITGNSAGYYGGGLYATGWYINLTNCIFWENTDSSGQGEPAQAYIVPVSKPTVIINYCCIQGWTGDWGGNGNIDADPCFVDPANDDYHLKSEGWSWDIKRSRWTYDDVTSRCIDAGNPGSLLGYELLSVPDDPNNEWGQNLRIDMGAFGGTAEASIPPYDWAMLSDATNDGISDFSDLDILSSLWLNTGEQLYADFNRDGIINLFDFALLAQDWLEQTSWH